MTASVPLEIKSNNDLREFIENSLTNGRAAKY